MRPAIIRAYVIAIDHCYVPMIVSAGLSLSAVLFMKNYNIKERGAMAMAAAA